MNAEEMATLRMQDRTIATLREQLAAAEARVKELVQERGETLVLLEQMREHYKNNLALRERVIDGQRERIRARFSAVFAEHDTLKSELQQAVAHNHDLEDAIAMGEHTVEVLEARAQDLQISLNHQRERARQAVYAFDHQVKEVESLEAYWEQDRDRWRFAAGRLKTAFKHERDSLKARVQELEKHVQDAWKAAGAQHKEMIDAQAQIVVKDRVLGKVLNVPKCPECGTRRCAVCWGHGGLHTEDCDARAALANGTECDEDEVEIRIADYLANVIDLTGAGEPNCATCRREDCWPDCARSDDKPELPR